MIKQSRLETGKVELNLEDIITKTVDECEILLMKKNIRVEVEIKERCLFKDRNQIITVVRNFLSNTIKHINLRIVITADKGIAVFNKGCR